MHSVERKSSGSAFHRVGPARENEQRPYRTRLYRGTTRNARSADRRERRDMVTHFMVTLQCHGDTHVILILTYQYDIHKNAIFLFLSDVFNQINHMNPYGAQNISHDSHMTIPVD